MSDVVAVYADGRELDRMTQPRNRVEWVRTCELLQRWLPSPPAVIADVGSGPGCQAQFLTGLGYEVRLFDVVPLHVQAARERGLYAEVADARDLPLDDASTDAICVLGPACHLPEPVERQQLWAEMWRIGRPGAVLIAAAISRFARPLIRAAAGELADPATHAHTMKMITLGHDPDGGDNWDAVVFHHSPDGLAAELTGAGFTNVEIVGVEGPVGPWARLDPSLADHAIEIARATEYTMAACSIHLLARAIKVDR